VPLVLVLVHLAFLAGVVVFAHHPGMFMGLSLFFLGVAELLTQRNTKFDRKLMDGAMKCGESNSAIRHHDFVIRLQ
jgi:hypothetical protein